MKTDFKGVSLSSDKILVIVLFNNVLLLRDQDTFFGFKAFETTLCWIIPCRATIMKYKLGDATI